MDRGYDMKRKYEKHQQLELMHLIRYVGHTVLLGIPTKSRKPSLERYYPLQGDKPKEKLSKQQLLEIFSKKDPVISNGKIRGYRDKNGNFEAVN